MRPAWHFYPAFLKQTASAQNTLPPFSQFPFVPARCSAGTLGHRHHVLMVLDAGPCEIRRRCARGCHFPPNVGPNLVPRVEVQTSKIQSERGSKWEKTKRGHFILKPNLKWWCTWNSAHRNAETYCPIQSLFTYFCVAWESCLVISLNDIPKLEVQTLYRVSSCFKKERCWIF